MTRQHQEDWNVYITEVDGDPVSISLDLARSADCPDRHRPVRVTVGIANHDRSRDGLPSKEEYDAIIRIEDFVLERMADVPGAVHVGSIHDGTRRAVVFYAPADVEVDESMFDGIPDDRRAEPFVEVANDSDWELYREFMFPAPEELREMMDEGIIRQLVAAGDDLTIPRRVDHWAYFENPDDLPGFLEWCEENGYAIEGQIEPDDDDDRSGVQFYHETSVVPEVIHEAIAGIVEAAEAAGGEYDGWETFVMKPE